MSGWTSFILLGLALLIISIYGSIDHGTCDGISGFECFRIGATR